MSFHEIDEEMVDARIAGRFGVEGRGDQAALPYGDDPIGPAGGPDVTEYGRPGSTGPTRGARTTIAPTGEARSPTTGPPIRGPPRSARGPMDVGRTAGGDGASGTGDAFYQPRPA